MQTLALTLVQSDMIWEDRQANLAMYDRMTGSLGPRDLILLPEMFQTGFSMNAASQAEPPEGDSVQWMRALSRRNGGAVAGSLIIQEGGKYYNRLVFMLPDGSFRTYDKRHLFAYAGEDSVYSPGGRRLEVDWRGWRICPLICYDLRFPAWSRNTSDYDLLVYVANWPAYRAGAWQQLLIARAIENQCYVVGLNRCGTDGVGHPYRGGSLVVDYAGEVLLETGDTETVEHLELDRGPMMEFREKFPFLADRDNIDLH